MSRRQMAPSNHDEVLIQDEVQRSQGWIGTTIEIHPIRSSRGNGPIRVMNSPKNEVTTTLDESAIDDAQLFVVEAAPGPPGAVSFRCKGGAGSGNRELFLTMELYGEDMRNQVVETLLNNNNQCLLAEQVGLIVDFAVGPATDETNFEGAGFNYQPMSVLPVEAPTLLQSFRLVARSNNCFGIQSSTSGTFWRHEWWNSVISQSPHCESDEQFRFVRAPSL